MHQRIGEKGGAHAFALGGFSNRKTAEQLSRQERIAGQLLDDLRCQGIKRDAGGGESVKPSDFLPFSVERRKARRNASFDVLTGPLPEIAIERCRAADKSRLVVVGAKRLDSNGLSALIQRSGRCVF